MNMKRFLAMTLSICMLLSLIPAAPARASETEDLEFEVLDGSVNPDLTNPIDTEDMSLDLAVDPNEMVKVIVVMDEKSILEGNAQVVYGDRLRQEQEALQMQQQIVIEKIQEDILNGGKLEVEYQYTVLDNAFAATVPFGSIHQIEALDGVERVVIQQVYNVCETADPNTVSDGVMIGRESTWANGYTGAGMKIAIIDTGLDVDHQNFAALSEDKLTDTSADADTIAAVLANLNAGARYAGLSVEDVHYNTKVVFGFNYCDDNLNITHDYDGMGDHGTHVAGIASANKVADSDVVGVAPDAQLYVMKVFGANGGAYTADILAALEDALMLGADVINMSLGTPAGFTSSGDEYLDSVYANISNTGTVLSVSAGNNYTSGYDNMWGTDLNLTKYPDNGVGGSPGTYANTMTVASVENCKVMRTYIDAGGYQIGYIDSGETYGLPALPSLTGEYQVVYVPGTGAPEDYEGLDVAGKVALVQRGELSFLEKHTYAEAQGAVATLIFNNTSGEFGMDMTDTTCVTPAAAITFADGAYLVYALQENPELTISFPKEEAALPSATAYQMSEFSSWGPTPDMTLSPDITAPGGNIYSTINNGQYGLMSGTSMAAPNIAGMTALVMQYVRENFPEGTDYRKMTQYLLMSTAAPLEYAEGLPYSPRQQGSGLGNAFNAVTTKGYLTVDGEDYVKIDLGDDNGRTGVYHYAFNVHNFGDSTAYYVLDTNAQTEAVAGAQAGTEVYYFMSGTPVDLGSATAETSDSMVFTHDVDNDGDTDSHDAYYIYQAAMGTPVEEGWQSESFRYDINADETVAEADVQAYLNALVGKESEADLDETVLMVESGETAVVNVNVTLGEGEKAYFANYFPNGGYVEGFTTLTALHDGGVDLSLPYLAFYGDWAESPALDEVDYVEYLQTGNVGNQYINALFSQFGGDEYGIYPGMNAYVDEVFDPAHISLSPNGDGYLDSISDIYLSLMRHAYYLGMEITNAETGEELYSFGGNYAPKSVFNQSYGQVVPFVHSMYGLPALPDLEDQQNNTKLLFTAEVIGMDPDAQSEYWQIPITIDLEAPQLLGVKRVMDLDTGDVTMTLSFRDNVSTAAVILADSAGMKAYAIEGVEDVEPDENGCQNYTMSFDITGLTGKIMIILSDYAVNESYYGINLGGEGTPYGDLVAYQYNLLTGTNGWVSFGTDVAENETTIFTNYEMDFVAAEYVNGFVYAQTEDGKLYGFKYSDMLNNTMTLEDVYITQLENVYQDFAYDYVSGKLLGLVTYVDGGYPTSEINSINIWGEYYDEDMWMNVAAYQEDWFQQRGGVYGLSLAVDGAGNLYLMGCNYDWDTESIGENAHLWVAPREVTEDRWGSYVDYFFQDTGDTGVTMDYLQSMTWNHNTDKLYWARFDASLTGFASELYAVDVNVAEDLSVSFGGITKLGDLSGETCGLFAPLNDETAAQVPYTNVPEMDENEVGTPILRDETVTMSLGGTRVLGYDIDPWFSSVRDVVWSSDDETVATVDQNGMVTAVGEGSAVITLTSAADETKFDTCTIEVSALSLKLEGIVSAQGSGIGNVSGVGLYEFAMNEGVASMTGKANITASAELNYGLSLATSELGRGSIWACEYGNTGMVYEIDAESGEVKQVYQPIDGDMMFGMHYSDKLDSFTTIMNFYLYTDLTMDEKMYEEMEGSYDEAQDNFMYHRINMLPYLREAGGNFVTGETGQGASSEIVFCGITGIDGGIRDAYGETYYTDTYRDYLGNWAMGGTCSYQPVQTLILLDNVGRLWYVNQVSGVSVESDEYGNVFLTTADGGMLDAARPGVIVSDYTAEDGTCTVFHITQIVETPLTDMFREGTMPRYTYHFSDIEFAGYTAAGDPMIAMSLYDYWNNGTTNELYLYIPGHDTGEMDYETWEPIFTPDRLFTLGNTGEYNIIASIHAVEVTGGVDPVEEAPEETVAVNKLTAGLYKAQ